MELEKEFPFSFLKNSETHLGICHEQLFWPHTIHPSLLIRSQFCTFLLTHSQFLCFGKSFLNSTFCDGHVTQMWCGRWLVSWAHWFLFPGINSFMQLSCSLSNLLLTNSIPQHCVYVTSKVRLQKFWLPSY